MVVVEVSLIATFCNIIDLFPFLVSFFLSLQYFVFWVFLVRTWTIHFMQKVKRVPGHWYIELVIWIITDSKYIKINERGTELVIWGCPKLFLLI